MSGPHKMMYAGGFSRFFHKYKCWCGENMISPDARTANREHSKILNSDEVIKVKVITVRKK